MFMVGVSFFLLLLHSLFVFSFTFASQENRANVKNLVFNFVLLLLIASFDCLRNKFSYFSIISGFWFSYFSLILKKLTCICDCHFSALQLDEKMPQSNLCVMLCLDEVIWEGKVIFRCIYSFRHTKILKGSNLITSENYFTSFKHSVGFFVSLVRRVWFILGSFVLINIRENYTKGSYSLGYLQDEPWGSKGFGQVVCGCSVNTLSTCSLILSKVNHFWSLDRHVIVLFFQFCSHLWKHVSFSLCIWKDLWTNFLNIYGLYKKNFLKRELSASKVRSSTIL